MPEGFTKSQLRELKPDLYDSNQMTNILSDPDVTEDQVQKVLNKKINNAMQDEDITNDYSRSQLKAAQSYWVKQAAWEYGQKTEASIDAQMETMTSHFEHNHSGTISRGHKMPSVGH